MKGVFTQDQVKLQGLDGQTDETNAHQAHFKEAVPKRTVNGILTYRCRDVLFSPKKLGLQDKDVNRNLGLSLLWQGSFQLSPEVSTSNCPPSISRGRVALELRFGAELRLTCQGKNGSQGTEKAFARTKLLDKTELCGENRIWNETVRRLTSLLLAPLLQRRPGVLAESLTSHWDASSCKRLSSTYICFTGTKKKSVHDPVIS